MTTDPQGTGQAVQASAGNCATENGFGRSCSLSEQEVVEILGPLDCRSVHGPKREGAGCK